MPIIKFQPAPNGAVIATLDGEQVGQIIYNDEDPNNTDDAHWLAECDCPQGVWRQDCETLDEAKYAFIAWAEGDIAFA